MPQFQKLHPIKESSGSIANIDALCRALDISSTELAQVRALSSSQRYEKKEVPKKDGSTRTVHNPHYALRKIQRRINRRIFANPDVVSWPDYIFGSIPNDESAEDPIDRDYVNCARQHCGAKSILSVDIKDFFNNIHRHQVIGIFKNFLKYSEEVSVILADICCDDEHVVQGALTSSYIASLCLFETEGDLAKKLGYKGLVYTRFVDDITISSKIAKYEFSYALTLTEQMLNDAGLPLNSGKTKVQNASMKPLIVHGLRVDFEQPRLPPDEARRIRASVKNLELLAASPGYRASRSYRKDFNRSMGRVNKLARVGHSQHSILLSRLRRILPLPSHADIGKAEELIQRLQKDFWRPNYQTSYWFHKRYHVAIERLGILKRSFPKKAEELNRILKLIRPASRND
ncbi:Reverse transcriptase (RNA-dependent DNA polymerase) [Variovorax boronicumulans]|uniref:reverse transcriptase family protein n=1 Tax=Variovorax boronicumulans TaxID=436515 RepID=UPI000BB2E3D7|nr:reverse transcriptase family protein [Variovorax boronicumulans]PBI91230.1 Reverse transcriptase (RNA-dependent DNA polymerase) [Variovorax boronicumulans]